jgi:nucleoside-diphosphate-sugar epimerase
MNCLVTGGAGFLGRTIVKQLLIEGHRVKSLGRSAQSIWEGTPVEVIRCDLTEAEELDGHLAGVDSVFHTAAIAGVWGPAKTYHNINVIGTQNLLRACQNQGVQRFIFSSSPSVVFNGVSHLGADESLPYPIEWFNHYQRTKAIAEQLVLKANGQALKTVSLRPHLIIGKDDPHLIPRMISKAKAGKLKIVGSGDNRVDMVHVENAARAHVLAELALRDGKAAGEAFFITNGEPTDMWRWMTNFLEAIGVEPPKDQVPFWLAYVAGGLFERVFRWVGRKEEPPMTRFVAKQLSTHHTYDISKAKSILGYEPKISMAEATEELIAHWKEKLSAVETEKAEINMVR